MINKKYILIPVTFSSYIFFKIPITKKLKEFINLVNDNINSLNTKLDCVLHTHMEDVSFRYTDFKIVRIKDNKEVSVFNCKDQHIHFNKNIYFSAYVEKFDTDIKCIPQLVDLFI